MTVCVSIQPLDTVFFRESLPFTAGESNFAESGLPSPLTIYGAIGSYYLETNKLSLDDFKSGSLPETKLGRYSEDLKDTGFTIKGPFLAYDNTPYFPAPANIWMYGTPYLLTPRLHDNSYISDLAESGVNFISLEGLPDGAKPLSEFISAQEMQVYLSGDKEIWLLDERKPESGDKGFVSREIRYGHQLNPYSRTVQEQMLYSARHLRFQDGIVPDGHYHRASLIVVVDKLEARDFPQKVFNIGGEKRLACFMPVNDCFSSLRNMDEAMNKIKERRQFFVYLAALAIFDGGWQPKKWPAEFDGAKLIGAAVNKPLYISGWQRSGKGMIGSPRELKRAVPAGSVYFFKTENWDDQCFEALYTKYNFGESISSYYPDAGFGTTFIGAW